MVIRLMGSFISITGMSSRAPFERKLGRRYKPSRWNECPTDTLDLPEERRNILIVKRKTSTEKRVENDARRPHVHLGTRVQTSRNDFWRGVVGGSARGAEEVAIHQEVRKTEVGDLDVIILIQ